jgi:small nuclear ribonucleoprotein (snRNP)-like protein
MKNKIPVFTSLAAQYENSGPLSLLHSIHVKRQRVRVLVRYVDCIRGTLTGYLISFDKHMNLLLRDVDEVYTSRITMVMQDVGLTKSELELERRKCLEGASKGDAKPHNPRVKVGKRHMHQLLVRGDNVVSIWKAGGDRPRSLLHG